VAHTVLRREPVRTVAPRKVPKRTTFSTRLRQDWPLLVMVAPAVLLLVVFNYVPLLGYVTAFQDYSPFTGFVQSPFVGVEQFVRLVSDSAFWGAVSNTVQITALQLIFFFPAPIALALLLNSMVRRRWKQTIQSIIYLPHFLSWVIVIAMFQQVLGGAGLLRDVMPVDVMTDPSLFKVLVTSQVIWKDTGWGTIIFLAALTSINTDLYEAAAADGAGRLRRLWHVTLPGLRPVIILLLILRLGEALNVGFEQIILQRDAVGAAAGEVLDTFVYYNGLLVGDFSYGAAAGLIKGLVGLALVLVANRLAHAFGEQGVYSRT
jgi:putative aldouronate transport system permease protein